jgi:hypothetical protein
MVAAPDPIGQNQLTDAEYEQRKAAALKSAEARRKKGVEEVQAMKRNAAGNVANRRAEIDYFLKVAADNQRDELMKALRNPNLSPQEAEMLRLQLADIYETERELSLAQAQKQAQDRKKLAYHRQKMAEAAKRYDSAEWDRQKQLVDELEKEIGLDEEAAGLVRIHDQNRKQILADWERQRRAAEKEAAERQRQLEKFYREVERQQKKAEREREKAAKSSKDKYVGNPKLTDYQHKLIIAAQERNRQRVASRRRRSHRATPASKP